MLNASSWNRELSRLLNPPDGSSHHVAVVGVGQVLRGDDGAGPVAAGRLRERIALDDDLIIINAGHAPENCLGDIIRFKPDTVLFIDTVNAAKSPGTLVLFPAEEGESTGGSTHTLSIGLLAEYLTAATGAAVYVLGIQPANITFSEGLSTPVETAVCQAVEAIIFYWRKAVAACSAMSTGEISVVNT